MIDWTLRTHPSFSGIKGPVVLCVMDGVGLAPPGPGNAVSLARTPNLDMLAQGPLCTSLQAHGQAVGMPSDDDMGNSEVGHNAMGAGRVFAQGAALVSQAVANGSMFEGQAWNDLITAATKQGQCLHLIGLLSDGNVHSHIDHVVALLERAQRDVKCVRVHILLDGRDVLEHSALDYVKQLEGALSKINQASGYDYRIASGGGRMVTTMDRYEADWSIVKRGWDAHVHGLARGFRSATEAIATFRQEQPGVSDQQLPAFVVVGSNREPIGKIRSGDAVIFFNFRGDRAIEISRAFTEQHFSEFDRGEVPQVVFAGMLQYDGDRQIPPRYLVTPPNIDRTVGEYLARNQVTQLAVSETQKFGHVTYFWNGNRGGMFDERYETYCEIPSDLRPFQERPWMKAAEITDVVVDELRTGKYRHARLNFANGDMVGHTSILEAAVLAVEAVDLQLGRLIAEIRVCQGALIVTADHGNAEEMFEMDAKTAQPKLNAHGQPIPKTSHTLNPVPMYLYAPGAALTLNRELQRPGLANLTATILHLLGYQAPSDYCASLLA